MKRASIFSLLVVTLAACGGGDYAASESATADVSTSDVATTSPASAPAADVAAEQTPVEAAVISSADTVAFGAPETVPGVAAVSLNPMLVRTGQAVLQVDSLNAGITRVRGLARRVGGLVGNTTISAGTEETRRAQMELRIPSVNFDDAVGHLAEIGKVESVNVTAEDVGEEYTDVSARVANARQTEARLLELMNTREGRLDEVLNLEREVARVRGEIEQYEGRLRYLRSRSSVSLLTVTLHEPQTVMGSPSGERPIRDAFVTAWYSFVRLLAGLISSLGVLIPLGVLAYLGWRMFRRVQRRDEERSAFYRETLRRARAQKAEKTSTAAPRVEADADAEVEEPVGR
ncbi:DUF4349 domain-containing protein [Longimicrobium sp.]|uniref:DUF4349 domain-containing protein n=1 Tax=Longimicrobium sp. TaxID=2029185 RepID=UPI002E322C74|nr:DUF4349 domain-containing protein [Longimicrobium sp.]HEX6036444.1 DUF4349 domain-containing protein [Longimicrobium sp.]